MDYMYKERQLEQYNDEIINEYRRFMMMSQLSINKAILNIGGSKNSVHLTKERLIVHATIDEWEKFLYSLRFVLGIKEVEVLLIQNTFQGLLSISSVLLEKEIPFRLKGMADGLREETFELRKQSIEDIKAAFRGDIQDEKLLLEREKSLLLIQLKTESSDQEQLLINSEEITWKDQGYNIPILSISIHYKGQESSYFKKQFHARMKSMFALKDEQYITIVTK